MEVKEHHVGVYASKQINIWSRQNMANWYIRLGEEYLSVLYDHLHKELYSYHVIQVEKHRYL